MKYPINQFETLIKILKQLKKAGFNMSVNPSQLYYFAFQQTSKGQEHNWVYIKDGNLVRAHQLKGNFDGAIKVVDETGPFELYPDGCNDSHIETAVKKALQKIND
jgi:hypothetical protein